MGAFISLGLKLYLLLTENRYRQSLTFKKINCLNRSTDKISFLRVRETKFNASGNALKLLRRPVLQDSYTYGKLVFLKRRG